MAWPIRSYYRPYAISHLLCALARPYHRGVTSGVTVCGDIVFFLRHDFPIPDAVEIPPFAPCSPLTDFAVTRIFMTVRHEIAEARRETGARSPEAPTRTRAVRGGSEGRARRPKACRSSGSAVTVEALMNNVGCGLPYRHIFGIVLFNLTCPADQGGTYGNDHVVIQQ